MNEIQLAPSSRAKVAGALAALAVGGTLIAVLLGLFDSAGPERWAQPTPELMGMVAQCDGLPARDQRLRCTQQVVAAIIGHHQREVLLAER